MTKKPLVGKATTKQLDYIESLASELDGGRVYLSQFWNKLGISLTRREEQGIMEKQRASELIDELKDRIKQREEDYS